MPDYAVVKSLCQGLEITVAELMDGEETEEKSIRTYDDDKIMDLLKRTQELEQQKNILYGVLLLIIGIALQALSHTIGGSDVRNFFSGLLLGVPLQKCWSVFMWPEKHDEQLTTVRRTKAVSLILDL